MPCLHYHVGDAQPNIIFTSNGVLQFAYIHVFKRTCHLHISLPPASSLTKAKSLRPSFTLPQSPVVSPARNTDPSVPIATSLTLSFPVVPFCRACETHKILSAGYINGMIHGRPDVLLSSLIFIVVGHRRPYISVSMGML